MLYNALYTFHQIFKWRHKTTCVNVAADPAASAHVTLIIILAVLARSPSQSSIDL